MAGSNRRFAFAAVALPFLFLVMSGLARANDMFVNTTSGESESAPLCSLPDAITAHNIPGTFNGCGPANGNDRIFFAVTGTILIDEPLEISSGTLSINGPLFGCTGAGPCGIAIDGGGTVQIIQQDPGTVLSLKALTLQNGLGITLAPNTGGGAIAAHGIDLNIDDCLFVNNTARGSSTLIGGEGGAIYAGITTGQVVIVNSTFANNTAVGGIPVCDTSPLSSSTSTACDMSSASPPIFTSSTSFGGAISNDTANLKITNCTFSGNSADIGGGIDFGGPTNLKNTIFGNNTGGNCSATPFDKGGNISDDGSCAFHVAPFLNNTNPLLVPLANNGGPTDTFALQFASPAFDFISLAQCTDQQFPTPQPLGTDQRLFGRPDPFLPVGCDSGAFEIGAQPFYDLTNHRVQVARSSSANKDQVNIAITFNANGDPDCDLGPGGDEDALNSGFSLSLFEGTCAALPANGLMLSLFPFVVHTVNHQQYGTLFQTSLTDPLQQSSETVSARMVALPTPNGACGAWTLNLEVAGLNTATLGLPDGNPFALVLRDSPGSPIFADAESCFDITDAIVGNQTPPPPHGVRRRVRRR
jgi:hypothetical protein